MFTSSCSVFAWKLRLSCHVLENLFSVDLWWIYQLFQEHSPEELWANWVFCGFLLSNWEARLDSLELSPGLLLESDLSTLVKRRCWGEKRCCAERETLLKLIRFIAHHPAYSITLIRFSVRHPAYSMTILSNKSIKQSTTVLLCVDSRSDEDALVLWGNQRIRMKRLM